MTTTFTLTLLASALLLCPAAIADKVDTTAASVLDLDRYLGTWYETARYENFFERGLRDVSAVYEKQEDGSIRVTNSGSTEDGKRKVSTGKATKEADSPAGELQVSFIPPHALFSTDYRILYVTPDYEGALVSDDDGSSLWLLQRRQGGDPGIQKMLLREARRRGFDTTKLISPVTPEVKASETEVNAD